ncbi:MAG TPA: PAS domain-containing protein, partial [Hellea balneolensis]|nr:PAS domain-containing protein [Hellea balneolensis]
LFDYWRSKCRNGTLPTREDINPVEIHQQLPMISLIEVCSRQEKRRFKYRLAGTGFWSMFEREITGAYIDELPMGSTIEYWHRVLGRVVDLARPSAGVTQPQTPCKSHLAQFWIRLPLASDGKTPDMILGFDHLVSLSDVKLLNQPAEKITA